MKIFLLMIFVASAAVDAMEFQCNFFSWQIGYVCDVISFKVSSSDDHEITKITGEHAFGKSNDDVELFYSDEVLPVMPNNLADYFQNLDLVCFNKVNITAITKELLEPFGDKLTTIHFQRIPQLEVVESDAFEGTPNLKKISFIDSNVKYVGKGAFDSLKNLKSLHFKHTSCLSKEAIDNRAEVLDLIQEIETQCVLSINETTTSEPTTSESTSTTEDSESTTEEITVEGLQMQIIEKLEAENERIKAVNKQLLAEIEKYKNLKTCDESLDELKDFKAIQQKMMEKLTTIEAYNSNLAQCDAKMDSTNELIKKVSSKIDSYHGVVLKKAFKLR